MGLQIWLNLEPAQFTCIVNNVQYQCEKNQETTLVRF